MERETRRQATVRTDQPEYWSNVMETLRQLLKETLGKTEFEVEPRYGLPQNASHEHFDRHVSASELSDVLSHSRRHTHRAHVRVNAPQREMSALADALRSELDPFVDPQHDRIGHAFPTDNLTPQDETSWSRTTFRSDGFIEEVFTSSVLNFATSLVRAAAIMSVERVVDLVGSWVRGEPVEVHTTTVLNNLYLSNPANVTDAIELVPLGLTTASLPRLPTGIDVSIQDYLGLTLFKARSSASPALFRPSDSDREHAVCLTPSHPYDLDLLCKALSLASGRRVTSAHLWNDYPGTRGFFLGTPATIQPQGHRMQRIPHQLSSMDPRTGAAQVQLEDDFELHRFDVDNARSILEALPDADDKLIMAIHRWSRSTDPDIRLADRYIDLRIALELLYLQKFRHDKTVHSEMRFRLALFGAWHLSECPQKRAKIRKVLLDAYDTASGAVHTGDVPANTKTTNLLSNSLALCRRGLVKLLRDGAPDWGELVLGG